MPYLDDRQPFPPLRRAAMLAFLCFAACCICGTARADVDPFTGEDYDRPYNQNSYLTAHDSFDSTAYSYNDLTANQDLTITQQLQSGVRGLVFYFWYGVEQQDSGLYHFLDYQTLDFTPNPNDNYDALPGSSYLLSNADWYVAHGQYDSDPAVNAIFPGGHSVMQPDTPFQKVSAHLTEVKNWLAANPREVVTIGWSENLKPGNDTPTQEYNRLMQAFHTAGLDTQIFWADRPNPSLPAPDGTPWEVRVWGYPTLRQMAGAGLHVVAQTDGATKDLFSPGFAAGTGGDFSGSHIPIGGIVNQPDPSTMGSNVNTDRSVPLSYLGVSDTAVLTGADDSNTFNQSSILHDYIGVNRLIQGHIPNYLSVDRIDHGGLMPGEPYANSPYSILEHGALAAVRYCNQLWSDGGNAIGQFRADDFEARTDLTKLDGDANLDEPQLFAQNGVIIEGSLSQMHRLDPTDYTQNPKDGYALASFPYLTHVRMAGSPADPDMVFVGAAGRTYAFHADDLNAGPVWEYDGFNGANGLLFPFLEAENVSVLVSDDGRHVYTGCYGWLRDLYPASVNAVAEVHASNNLSDHNGDGFVDPVLGFITNSLNNGTLVQHRLLVGINSHIEWWDGDDIRPGDSNTYFGLFGMPNSDMTLYTVHPSATSAISSIYAGCGGIVYHLKPFGAGMIEDLTLPNGNGEHVNLTSLSTSNGTILYAGCAGRVYAIPLDQDGNFTYAPNGGVHESNQALYPISSGSTVSLAVSATGRLFAGCNGRSYELNPYYLDLINWNPLLNVDVTSQAFANQDVNVAVLDDATHPMLFSGVYGNVYDTKLYDRDQWPPVTAISGLPSGYATGTVNLVLTASDSASIISGVRSITYSMSGAVSSGPVTHTYTYNSSEESHDPYLYDAPGDHSDTFTLPQIAADGITQVTYYAADFAGNQERPHVVEIKRDTTPPVTTAAVSPLPNAAGWNSGNVGIRLSATDNLSGVAATYDAINGGSQSRYSASSPINLTTEGITTVTYNSVDGAGNQEAAKTLTVRIDKTAPKTTVTPTSQGPGGLPFGCRMTGVDPASGGVASGVASVNYAIDNGPLQSVPGSVAAFTSTVPGTHTLTDWSVDAAGNKEPTQTHKFTVAPAAQDVTHQVALTLGPIQVQFPSLRATQTVTIKNTGTATLAGPVSFVLDYLVFTTLASATGTTAAAAPAGSPYQNASVSLAPGAQTSLTLTFSAPIFGAPGYVPRVLAGSGTR